MGNEDLSVGGCQTALARMRDIETIDAELLLVAAFRRAARDRGGPLPSTAPMDELLDERLTHAAGRLSDDAAVGTGSASPIGHDCGPT